MSSDKADNTDQRAWWKRILLWDLPGSHVWFRSMGSPYLWLFPILKEFDTPKQRHDALQKAYNRQVMRNPRFWLLMLAFLGMFALLICGAYRGMHEGYLLFLEWFLIAGCSFMTLLLFQARIRRHLRQQLFDLGHPICVKCGYNLTGNISGRCSECGRRIPSRDTTSSGSDNMSLLSQDVKTQFPPAVSRHGA